MIRVYIAGPYSKPDPCINTHHAIKVADDLLARGYCPYVPHLTHFWHTVSPKPYQTWLDYDTAWIPQCHVLLRLPGESSGADKEVEIAKAAGLAVFYGVEALLDRVPPT